LQVRLQVRRTRRQLSRQSINNFVEARVAQSSCLIDSGIKFPSQSSSIASAESATVRVYIYFLTHDA
ncbi:hypothetical protein, partial [Escherichia coli]|uniref:hypothetical protein n=1 Tax=Escherichia coli TaxID=562 RepID=UPI003B7ABC8A